MSLAYSRRLRRSWAAVRSVLIPVFLMVAILPGAARALTITSFSPAGGPPGTPVSIRGTGFTGATAVKFNGIDAGYSIQSDTLITSNVPGSAATGPISVFVGVASATSPTNFFVGNAPVIHNFTPSGGAPGAAVTINGANFMGITTVRFNGVGAVFSVNSTSQIVATVPGGAGTGPITVTNPAGTASSSPFYFPPIITSVSPPGGVAGTPVTINGTNLSQVYQVDFNGVFVGYSIQSDSRIVTTVPGGATTGPLQVTSVAGSATIGFFVGPPPAIASLAPQGGPVGTPVVVSGGGFVGITSVTFAGVSASFSVQDANTLTATVPGGAVTGYVSVNNPAGTATSATPFFVGEPPVVSGFAPASGPVGSTVDLTGAHFLGATDVRFGGGVSASSFVVGNDGSITAVVPPFAVSGPIEVVNPAGSGSSVQTYNLSPRIVSFTPPSVPEATAAGTPVAITGYNLSSVFGVLFNGVSATFTPTDDQHMTAFVPAGATTGPITALSLFGNGVGPFPFEIVHFSVPPFVPGVAWPHWPDVNVPVATGPATQQGAAVAADSSGGAFIAWHESNGVNWDIRLQHLDAYGQRVAGWPEGGIPVADTTGNQMNPRLVADQVGGVIALWEDDRGGTWDLFALRITGSGQRAFGWTSQGVAVSTALGTQQAPRICSDGASGAFVAWEDQRNGNWDIYVQHLLADGGIASGWSPNGIPACTHGSPQQVPAILRATDGGLYVGWSDGRFGGPYPFLQRLQANGLVASGWPADGTWVSGYASHRYNALLPAPAGDVLVAFMDPRPIVHRMTSAGVPHPSWPTNGRVLSPLGGYNTEVAAATDGQGGAYVSWMQSASGWDVYASHVTSSGAIASGWNVSGVPITALGGDQLYPVIASDAQGGAFVAWHDSRYGDHDVYAQRLMFNVPTAPGWPANGAAVSQVYSTTQESPMIAGDGRGGTVLAWVDLRSQSTWDIYAQNLTGSSKLGNPEPTLLSAADVPDDQGGKVRIRWAPSYLDSLPLIEIGSYGIWRQTTEAAAVAAAAQGSAVLSALTPDVTVGPGVFLRVADATSYTYWEGLGSIPARGQTLYSFVASTLADSGSGGPADEVYMVDAHASFGPYFWETQPGTAHSVDNVAPSAPQGFTASYGGTSTTVHWHPNTENDLAGYRLYRGADPAFVPSDATLLAQLTDSMYVDPAGGDYIYKVEAVDIHGNRSAAAIAGPASLVGVGGRGVITRAEFGTPHPNPARSDARIELRLPAAQHVTIGIYDASGRMRRQLVAGVVPAGETVLLWDLRDTAGREVPAGLYFVRAESEKLDTRRRIMVIR